MGLKAGICDPRREYFSLCLHGVLAPCSRCRLVGVDKSLILGSQGGAQCVSPNCKCPENSLEPLAASEAIEFFFSCKMSEASSHGKFVQSCNQNDYKVQREDKSSRVRSKED